MNDLERSAMEQALEALDEAATFHRNLPDQHARRLAAMTALRAALAEDALQRLTDVSQEIEAALAEPVQEPVAWMTVRLGVPIQTTAREDVANEWAKWGEVQPLYAAPAQAADHQGN